MEFRREKTDGKNYTQSGVVENVVKATKYAFTFSYNADNAATGGTFIDVKVNESTVDSTHNVVITQRPQIVGDKFDITQPLYYETNSGKEAAIWVNAATKLKNVKLSCEKFPSLGLSADSIDFLSAPEDIITEFQVKGIGAKHIYQEDKDLSNAKSLCPRTL